MKPSWDEAKRRLNLTKHKIDVVLGVHLFDGSWQANDKLPLGT